MAFVDEDDEEEIFVPESAFDDYFEDELDDDEEDDDDSCESVCAICDNGGELLCCEGICMRSFHATRKDGEHSLCHSLGFTKMQVEAIRSYFCPNCKHKKHQCFICKNLGSSDNSVGAAEVYQCVSSTCGYFYHPRCVVKQQRLEENEAESEALEKQIIAGEFTCPLHKCSLCGSGEVKSDYDLQFAVCQRCPKSYHRKCLPRRISFGDIEEEDVPIRAWDGLLHNRVLIYCLEHEIDEELRTPIRDHIKFPLTESEKALLKEKMKILESHLGRDKARTKFKDVALQEDTCGKASLKSFKSSSKDGVSTKKHGLVSSVPENLRKRKELDPSESYKTEPTKSQKLMELKKPSYEAGNNKLGVKEADNKTGESKVCERVFNNIVKPVDRKHVKTNSVTYKETGSETPPLDNDSHRRPLTITKEATKESTMDSVLKRYKVPSTLSNSKRNVVEKTITTGKGSSVQAVGAEMKKLEEERSIPVVCSTSYNTTPQRSQQSVEASMPVITRTQINLGNDIKEPHSEVRNSSSAVRFPHYDNGLAARFAFGGGGYRMAYPPFRPYQFSLAPTTRNGPNEIFDNRVVGPRGGYLDPMLAPFPPNLMDSAIPIQQRYVPHFNEMNDQRMSDYLPHPPVQPSGHSFYDPPRGFPLQPPQSQPGDSGMSLMGFAPASNYPYMGGSGGWLDD